MTSYISNIFSYEDIQYLKNCETVLSEKENLSETNAVYFSIPITESIRHTITNSMGLDLTHVTEIPMRWLKGDIKEHFDVGENHFNNTYLAYIEATQGEFIIDNTTYPITENTAFVFDEGILHKTQNTGENPRLLLGPMNELALPVGIPNAIVYYGSYMDAINYTNPIGYSGNSYTVGVGASGGYTSWRIAPNSSGTSSQSAVYTNGLDLDPTGEYYLYPPSPCFLSGTKVLCLVDEKETYVNIEHLRKGDLVKTYRDGYKQLELLGEGNIYNSGNSDRIQNRLYKCSPNNYPELTSDLYITGCHSILVNKITDVQREKTISHFSKIYVTDKMYRLMTYIDERSEPWSSEGNYSIWHLALESDDEKRNYGIYVNGGLLVETCCLQFLKTKSNMVIQ
jgi:hypothetical protein